MINNEYEKTSSMMERNSINLGVLQGQDHAIDNKIENEEDEVD